MGVLCTCCTRNYLEWTQKRKDFFVNNFKNKRRKNIYYFLTNKFTINVLKVYIYIYIYIYIYRYIYCYNILDDWSTVLHRSITLVDLQLDAQNSCLFTYNTVIKIPCMFRALPCSSSGGLRRNCIQGVPGGMCQTSGGRSLC